MAITEATIQHLKFSPSTYKDYPIKAKESIENYKKSNSSNYLKDSDINPQGNVSNADFETKKNILGYMIKNKEPAYLTATEINKTSASASVTKIKNLLSRGSLNGKGYMDFIITAYAVSYDERISISETFSVPFVSFYGKKMSMYNFTVVFRNDDLHQEWSRFKKIYDNYLRAPIAIENNYMLRLILMNNIMDGFITNLQIQQNEPNLIRANMNFIVVAEKEISQQV